MEHSVTYDLARGSPAEEMKNPNVDEEPFWIGKCILPNKDYIFERGSVCVGLTNIARRYLKLDIPGYINNKVQHFFIGGTDAWFQYLDKENRLNKIDFNCKYPKGTLLIQNYNENDQGHVAIIITDNDFLIDQKIIHNINEKRKNKKRVNSTIIEKFKDYPNYKRFTHICLPEKWLLLN